MKKRRIIIKTLILIIWMIIIFWLSNQNSSNSTDLTNGVIYNFFKIFNISDESINFITSNIFFIIRKTAHFFEYFILGILFMNFFKEFNVSFNKIIKCSILCCLLYALSDEIHQLFVNGRSGSIIDVGVDSLGFLIGILLYTLFVKRKTLSIR